MSEKMNYINPAILRQYSENLRQEMKEDNDYQNLSNRFKSLALLSKISEAEKAFTEIFNRPMKNGSFQVNDCVITIDYKTNLLRLCLDSPKDYFSFVFVP